MGCHSSKAASQPVETPAGTLLTSGDGVGKSPKATQQIIATPELTTEPCAQPAVDMLAASVATTEAAEAADLTTEGAGAESTSVGEASLRSEHDKEPAVIDATSPQVQVNEKSQCLPQPTSKVHKNPQSWEVEGILFPHEGIRFLMQELCDAVDSMDPLPAWKWDNLSTWYQDYFYEVVHHHHDAEEKIYLPWIQERVSVPAKITADHPELMQGMDDLSDMLKKGSALPAGERAQHLSDVQQVVMAFVEDMLEHLAEEEETFPRLLREGGFTQAEEGPIVEQIIQSLGLDGNKKALPPMLHAYARWAGDEKAEAFVTSNLPLPIQFLYRNFWAHDFQHRHMGLLASLAEGVVTNPFASKWFC